PDHRRIEFPRARCGAADTGVGADGGGWPLLPARSMVVDHVPWTGVVPRRCGIKPDGRRRARGTRPESDQPLATALAAGNDPRGEETGWVRISTGSSLPRLRF